MTGASDKIERLIAKWQGAEGGQERANYALFLAEFCDALELPRPDPAGATTENNDYVFERAVTFRQPDSSTANGRVDLYKRGCFVLEAKQSRLKGAPKEIVGQADLFRAEAQPQRRTRADRQWDVLMLNARRQAEDYAKALPSTHGWPPFIIICDVGHCFELYADFTGQGKNYAQFPDRQGFRIFLDDLRDEQVRERLSAIWSDPHALDPTRKSARVTRQIAARLAAVSKRLEERKFDPEHVALFLMRALFTMFAEDVELLPKDSFRDLLDKCVASPAKFAPMVQQLWQAMDKGNEFAFGIEAKVRQFNGNLFRDALVLALEKEEIGELREAAKANWREVDPSIFGTLLEQALDPQERSRLGAHYTPRAYVERLVVATVIEPLKDDWNAVLVTAGRKKQEGDRAGAIADVKAFHEKLYNTRILDPACGTGNFLYVALELMKRLEGEVLETLLDLGGQEALKGFERHEVDPHQFLGLEINERARHIAELVLWIGYLQWHIRTKGGALPGDPVLKDYKNIEHRDAVLAHDGIVVKDGKEVYKNPRRPDWPEAEFIAGNPPFIGGKDIRSRLGDAKTEALWAAHPHMNESADFVMYWWDRAAELLTRKGAPLRRFGLVTTNSITQVFQRRVVERYLSAKKPISLVMSIPDHPWTKATREAAAVRIAMTVAIAGKHEGVLREVIEEAALDTDEPKIALKEAMGAINADLTVGVDLSALRELRANHGLCARGVVLHGAGFIVSKAEAAHLGRDKRPDAYKHIRPYRNGRDITGTPRHVMVIDLFGLSNEQACKKFPEVYHHVLQNVKPERDQNRRAYRKENWWLFGENIPELRKALATLPRYIITVETAKHRTFQFLNAEILPDNKLVAIALDDAFHFGILSSHIHVTWSLRAGGWLGVGNDPVYIKSKCFDPFPFPLCDNAIRAGIAAVAEEIDAHRKERQRETGVTLTQMYNVLEKLRGGGVLDKDDEDIKERGLVLILKELHDRLDRLAARAYGWPEELNDDDILARLVALNAERAEEEKRGQVRWLRPSYQIPRFGTPKQRAEQLEADLAEPVAAAAKPSFPKEDVAQTAAVMAALASARSGVTALAIAQNFKQGRKSEKRIRATLESLARHGYAVSRDGGKSFALQRAGV